MIEQAIALGATSVLTSEFSDTQYFMDGFIEVAQYQPLFGFTHLRRTWSADIAAQYTRTPLEVDHAS
jgi:hypothetical protein